MGCTYDHRPDRRGGLWLVYEKQKDLPEIVHEANPGSRIRGRFGDMATGFAAARAGVGVVRMPMLLGRSLAGLVRVPSPPPQPYADIWIVARPDVWPSARLEAFRAIAAPHFRKMRPKFIT
ncbi:hypothetical protein RA27_09465 [Ruegeria sp. ANG-R]|uniref:LysR substrate-binding domain-containing protein n=1 Tax=Ruegeria sp. ANG-R TaxID=1577903 RepID=UPI00057D26FA|nr:LysR substrate-binding domain-containing protein [Ruegeria sp. ANG-R]KIC41471.1 hypothetical protein RA27_09465 [Ruegeria sp. ANG-R]